MTQEQKIKSAIKQLSEASEYYKMAERKYFNAKKQLESLNSSTGPKGPRKVTKNLEIDAKAAHAVMLRNRHIERKRIANSR